MSLVEINANVFKEALLKTGVKIPVNYDKR